MGIGFSKRQDHTLNAGTGTSAHPDPDRLAYLESVVGNVDTTYFFFNRNGAPTAGFTTLLLALPLHDRVTGEHIVTALQRNGNYAHAMVESALQAALYKKNEAKFSFEIVQGHPPSTEQLNLLRDAGLVDEIGVGPGRKYDVAVVFGGLLGAIAARTEFLLRQRAEFGAVGLLGSKRPINPEREGPAQLKTVLGQIACTYQALDRGSLTPDEQAKLYSLHQRSGAAGFDPAEREELNALYEAAGALDYAALNPPPATEFDLMVCVWETHRRYNPALKDVPVILVDSRLRTDRIKTAPGTPDTIVDLANALSVQAQEGRSAATFLLSSSQPFAIRQREDFLSTMAVLGYPGLKKVDVVGYAAAGPCSLELYGNEIAKLVHAQFLQRY